METRDAMMSNDLILLLHTPIDTKLQSKIEEMSKMAKLAPNSSPLADDDLAKWLDVDELCQDLLTNDGLCTSPPHSDFQHTEPTSTAISLSEESFPPSTAHEKGSKSKSKLKRSDGPKRRNLPEYSVICFPSNPAKPDGIKKKRKDFTEKRRLEVAQVRKTGACFRCKMRRISVR